MILTILATVLAKAIYIFLHLLGRGATTLPGRAALGIKYNLLGRLSRGVHIICVTGTNGKTTTCALLEHALKAKGLSYFINKSGANMLSGVATAFIMNSSIFGRCKKEYAILECDENSFPLISRYIDADIIAVTNLFRDQLDRYGEVSHTLSKIKEGIDNIPDALLVLNADCPLTYSLFHSCSNSVITFGVDANFNDIKLSDNRYCPVCSSELVYKSRVFAQLGDYACPNCDYKREKPDVSALDIAEVSQYGSVFFLNQNGKNTLVYESLGGVYNIYNFCCAAAVLGALKIDGVTELGEFSGAFGRMEHFKNGEQNILLLLVKNPVGMSACIRYVSKMKNEFDIAFALNDNDADGRDVSWIWDSDFDALNVKNSFIYTLGLRSYDMALRLKYSGFNIAEILSGEDYKGLVDIIEGTERDFVVLSTYTSMMNMRKVFISRFGGKEFWE